MHLEDVQSPWDIKSLSYEELENLAAEIRAELVATVAQRGGHLASNLGVVELTLALHRVFDMPEDKIIFDVGHQSYVHKLITGRYNRFGTLRSFGGLNGNPVIADGEFSAMENLSADAYPALTTRPPRGHLTALQDCRAMCQ